MVAETVWTSTLMASIFVDVCVCVNLKRDKLASKQYAYVSHRSMLGSRIEQEKHAQFSFFLQVLHENYSTIFSWYLNGFN